MLRGGSRWYWSHRGCIGGRRKAAPRVWQCFAAVWAQSGHSLPADTIAVSGHWAEHMDRLGPQGPLAAASRSVSPDTPLWPRQATGDRSRHTGIRGRTVAEVAGAVVPPAVRGAVRYDSAALGGAWRERILRAGVHATSRHRRADGAPKPRKPCARRWMDAAWSQGLVSSPAPVTVVGAGVPQTVPDGRRVMACRPESSAAMTETFQLAQFGLDASTGETGHEKLSTPLARITFVIGGVPGPLIVPVNAPLLKAMISETAG